MMSPAPIFGRKTTRLIALTLAGAGEEQLFTIEAFMKSWAFRYCNGKSSCEPVTSVSGIKLAAAT